MFDTSLKYQLYRSIWGALDLIFPPTCGGCAVAGEQWCFACRKKIRILDGVVCEICGLPQDAAGVCAACQAERPHFNALRAWAVFDDPIRAALHKLKYRRNISLGNTLAAQLIPFTKKLNWPIDVIVPIPLGRKRLKDRGYNQVTMIAVPLALALDVQYLNSLVRQKETQSQVGLTKNERQENVKGAFIADDRVKGKRVLVMDDVSTTGSTLSSAADALFLSGAKEVFALAVARALPHHGLKHA